MSRKVFRRVVLNGIHREMRLEELLEEIGVAGELEFGGRRSKGVWVAPSTNSQAPLATGGPVPWMQL